MSSDHVGLDLDGPRREHLRREAQRILDGNWRGESTVPSGTLYPHQWSWDSAFIAIGRSWWEQERAQSELEALFAGQWRNGMLPHILFNPHVPNDAYFPGPAFWRSDRAPAAPARVATSGITQPPLHARAALEIYQQAQQRDAALAFLRRLYPKLVAQHDYLVTARDAGGDGLAAIVHPWESGLDNSPAWDSDLDDLQIPPGALPDYHRRDLTHADPADRPTDAAYQRFVYLAMRYRDSGYDDAALISDTPFLVEDALFNSVWLWSAHALCAIAELIGQDSAPHRERADALHSALLRRLWDPVARRFCARDVHGGRRNPKDTILSYMPLLDPQLPPRHVGAIVDQLNAADLHGGNNGQHYLIPSLALRDRDFDPRRYWRGPVWINTNWLVWRGLRQHVETAVTEEITASMFGLVERSGFREYFNPLTGEGHGTEAFSWTAALILDRLQRLNGAV